MKKSILALTPLLFASVFAHAQWATNGTVTSTTNAVGIGTTSPATTLDVRGDVKWGMGSSGMLVSDGNGAIELGPFTSTTATPYFDFHYGTGASQDYNVRLINQANNLFLIQTNSGGIVFSVNGSNVGIGTTDTKGYKLGVNGGIIANSIVVKVYPWADYVFKKDYRLPSLTDVKTYIDQNHHLPEIPTEAEVARDGINLGQMNTLLLKKVEELTLYLIDTKQEVDALKKQVQELKAKSNK